MSKTSIKVQYVNQPKSPKGPGTVKTDTGVYYKVWPKAKGDSAVLSQFVEGRTYDVEYDTEQYNGEDRFTIRKILSSSESVATGTTASSNGHAPVATNDDRSARIERQAALKVAAVLLSAQVQAGKSEPTTESLFASADKIIAYINGTEEDGEDQEVEI